MPHAVMGILSSVKLLVEHGCNSNYESAVKWALHNDHLNCASVLIANRGDLTQSQLTKIKSDRATREPVNSLTV